MTGEELVARAERAAANAYAPYSNYLVGATVVTADGRVYDGVNVENAAYPLGICAEKTAIAKAASDGVRPGELAAIGITAAPCGGCRQWLHEWRIGTVSLPARGRFGRRVPARGSAAGRLEPPRRHEVGLHRRRRPAERRQVDARERALRRQGRDRLRQAADDAPPHLRDRERRRLPARARRPARLPAAARRADGADAAHGRRSVRGRRRGAVRAVRARAHRRRRPVHRASASSRSTCRS